MANASRDARRPPLDSLLAQLADYAVSNRDEHRPSDEAMSTARWCLLDSIGCAALALDYPECTKLLGPLVPEAQCPGGARVPCTDYELDPVQAAFNFGATVRWLDYNDTWLAAEWGHPSDNFGGLLPLADYLGRRGERTGDTVLTVGQLLDAATRAYEIQGVLALENAFNRVGLDHVLLVRIASTAMSAALLGCSLEQVANALTHAWIDGGALRTYRHAPNTGSRKSWAAGDATARGVRLALLARTTEMGYPSALSATRWGFQDVLFGGKNVTLARPLGSYVMENILFKVSYPAEFHAQTAVEAAIQLTPELSRRWHEVVRVVIETQESAIRIIDKTGPLANPADRDHCLQYMTAVALLKGSLVADDYEESVANNPAIDALREKMQVVENVEFSRDYLDPDKRSIGNAVTVEFADGTTSRRVAVEYPLGHRRRRAESIEPLIAKARANLSRRLPGHRVALILDLFQDLSELRQLTVPAFTELLLP